MLQRRTSINFFILSSVARALVTLSASYQRETTSKRILIGLAHQLPVMRMRSSPRVCTLVLFIVSSIPRFFNVFKVSGIFSAHMRLLVCLCMFYCTATNFFVNIATGFSIGQRIRNSEVLLFGHLFFLMRLNCVYGTYSRVFAISHVFPCVARFMFRQWNFCLSPMFLLLHFSHSSILFWLFADVFLSSPRFSVFALVTWTFFYPFEPF